MINFILKIIKVLIISGLALIISNQQKMGKNLLATASTVGLFYALGTTIYWFLNFIVAGVIMYFYINSKDIEETLLKIIVLTTTFGLLGIWRYSQKEGFNVSPLKLISSSLTTKQCQDACEGTLGCRFAQVPLSTSNSSGRFNCWNSYGFNQKKWGEKDKGGDTWENIKWKPSVTLPKTGGSYSGTIQTSGSTPGYQVIRYEMIDGNGIIPQEVYLKADMRDQGWGNATWGIYVEGYDKKGGVVFSKSLKAPRSSYKYPYYYDKKEDAPGYREVGYRGTQNKTDQGLPCQSWTSQYPHKHSRTPGNYRNKGLGGHNYCRNPDNEPGGIWCYTKSPWKRWKYCNPKTVRTFGGYKTTQGPLKPQTDTWELGGNETRIIHSIRCFVKTKGSGHSLRANNIRFHVKGWPQ